jgi:hypothetical protein
MEHSNKFDLKHERKAGNNFWKRGLGREEHRAQELAAKVKRNERKLTNESTDKIIDKAEKPEKVDD